jgi:hypothetical protein
MLHRDASESDQQPDAPEASRLVGVLHDVIDHLFAAELDVHMALELVDHNTEPALWMHSVVARLDTAITLILHAGLADATRRSGQDHAAIDAFDALASGLAGRFDVADYLRSVIDPSIVAQAERLLAERHHIPIAEAGTALTAYAHLHHQRLPDVARAVIDGSVDISDSVAVTARV